MEIQTEAGDPVDGFTAADADEITANSVRRVVTWKESSDVSALAGVLVRLRLVMRDTKLYAFQFKAKEK